MPISPDKIRALVPEGRAFRAERRHCPSSCGPSSRPQPLIPKGDEKRSGGDLLFSAADLIRKKQKILGAPLLAKSARNGAPGYRCNVRCNRKPYKTNQIDFLAAYVIPLDLWYLIPANSMQGGTGISSHPTARI